MILVLWLARLLDRLSTRSRRAADAVYRPWFAHQGRKAVRDEQRAEIERVIAESRTPSARVGSPLHRDD